MTVKAFYAVAPHYSPARTSIAWNSISLPVIPEEAQLIPSRPPVSDGDEELASPGLERQDSFELRFPDSTFSFPRPPREGVSSPTPSVMSISSTSSTSSALLPTPTASDDEFSLAPAPKKILRRTAAFRQLGEHSPESDDSDSEWYASELGKMLTLYSSPSPTSPGSLLEDIPPYPTEASPSVELDPSFPRRRSKPRRRHTVSERVPPVPPIPAHFRSLSASLPSTSSPLSRRRHTRPPPRSSLPSDADEEDDLLSYYTSPPTPLSAREQISPILEVVEENGETNIFVLDVDLDSGLQFPVSLPGSPIPPGELENDLSISTVLSSSLPTVEETAESSQDIDYTPSPELRSRWSTSTLGSLYEQQATSPVSKLWFQLAGAATKTKQSSPSRKSTSPPPSPPSKDKKVRINESPRRTVRTPSSPRPQSSRIVSNGIRRRASTTSTSSSSSYATSASSSTQSGMSTRSSSSNGLRRKPIPIEMFLRV